MIYLLDEFPLIYVKCGCPHHGCESTRVYNLEDARGFLSGCAPGRYE